MEAAAVTTVSKVNKVQRPASGGHATVNSVNSVNSVRAAPLFSCGYSESYQSYDVHGVVATARCNIAQSNVLVHTLSVAA